MNFQPLFLRIDSGRYHYLKFILEAYDGLCLLSAVPGKKGCVCIRYPQEQEKFVFELLESLSGSIKQ